MSATPMPPFPRAGELPEEDPRAAILDPAILEELLEVVWSTFVDPETPLLPIGPEPVLDAYAAVVTIHGASPLRVELAMSGPAAWGVAGAMMAGTGIEVSDPDVRDAVGELANVLGGNLKALLPEGARLTLPQVDVAASVEVDASVVAAMSWNGAVLVAGLRPLLPEEAAAAAPPVTQVLADVPPTRTGELS